MTDLSAKGLGTPQGRRARAAARELKVSIAENAYPAADGTADIDNDAIDVIAVSMLAFAESECRATPPEAVNDELVAALVRQRDNIDRWLATGVAAGPEESKSIYEQICAALDNAESARIATKEGE